MGLRQLDFFRKLNTDIGDTSSSLGGFLTIIAFALVTILTMNECRLFFITELNYQTVIDNDSEQFIKVHLDIIIGAPCMVLSLDQQDEVGVHVMDVSGTLKKISLDKDRHVLPSIDNNERPNYSGSEQELIDAIKAINQGDQCQLKGFFQINKVPGNFHISYHAHHYLIQRIHQRELQTFRKLKLDHTIYDLRFGEISSAKLKKYSKSLQKFQLPWKQIEKSVPEGEKQDYEYYINALPVKFYDVNELNYQTLYKYSINEASMPRTFTEIDSIYFKYQISPVNMVYSIQKKSVYHFIVQLLAIVGGVFAVIGILNSIIQKAM
ncbi:unnamed protein product [Paramecium pentaurelia]|uniref:Uncharacterized protein n=1 Tax=Paramecium pentaurelia TaxID=43138 RepID=A0A8S1VQW8_9CILI|nr:unnamed protein product [Paramecium pentaurelia]